MKTKFKEKAKQIGYVTKAELRKSFPIWLTQFIICGLLMIVSLYICYSAEVTGESKYIKVFDRVTLPIFYYNNNADLFVKKFTDILFFVGFIFTLIYVSKALSYIYKKNNNDICSLTHISSKSLFCGKLFVSYIQSIMVVASLVVIAIVIGLFTGANFNNYEIQHFLNYIFYTLFVVAFYGLCASCSKSTDGAVVSYLIISCVVPAVVTLLRGIFVHFFVGVNLYIIPNKTIERIFFLSYDTSLIYIIFWVILSVCCFVLSNVFLSRNKDKSFRIVSPFLEYIIKICTTLIAGIFIGLFAGAFFAKNETVGFIVGFLVTSIFVYLILNVIYNKGFANIVRSIIVLAILLVVSVTGFIICDSNLMNYKNNIPNSDEIESAGFIYTNDLYGNSDNGVFFDSVYDFTEKEDIKKIVSIHQDLFENVSIKKSDAYRWAIGETFFDVFVGFITNYELENYYHNGYVISYKYKNGNVETYFYFEDYNHSVRDDMISELTITDNYLEKYRPLYNEDYEISSIKITGLINKNTLAVGTFTEGVPEEEVTDNQQFYVDVTNAFKTDLRNDKNIYETNKPLVYKSIEEYEQGNNTQAEQKHIIQFYYKLDNANYTYVADAYYIPTTYTNTIEVLEKYDVLNEDFTVNESFSTSDIIGLY